MTGPGAVRSPLVALGLRDLVLLAAWELEDHGNAAAVPLLRAAASLEADLRAISGPRALMLRDLIASMPVRPSVRREIRQRLH